ncbi:uncharacterized, partial [Tachysurus ichikawai]
QKEKQSLEDFLCHYGASAAVLLLVLLTFTHIRLTCVSSQLDSGSLLPVNLCTDTPPRFFYFSTQTCEINQIKHYEGRIDGKFQSASNEAEHCADGRPTACCVESVIAKFTGISVEEAEGLPENHQMCQRAPEWKEC